MAEIAVLNQYGKVKRLGAPAPKTWKVTAAETCRFGSASEVTSDFCNWLENHPDPSDGDITNKNDDYVGQYYACSGDVKSRLETHVADLVNIYFADDRSAKVDQLIDKWCVVPETKASFDKFNVVTKKGIVGKTVKMVEDRIKNVGNAEGKIHINFSKIDSNGNVVNKICEKSVTVSPGKCGGMSITEDGTCYGHSWDRCDLYDNIEVTLPSTPGTYYYGFKIWGEDESEPSYSEAMAMIRGRKAKPARRRRAGLSGNQKGAIAGVTGAVAGGLIGYVAGKR